MRLKTIENIPFGAYCAPLQVKDMVFPGNSVVGVNIVRLLVPGNNVHPSITPRSH